MNTWSVGKPEGNISFGSRRPAEGYNWTDLEKFTYWKGGDSIRLLGTRYWSVVWRNSGL